MTTMKKIEIEIPEGKKAEWVNSVLTLVDEKPQDITKRIKTFEDACDALGDEHSFVKEYWGVVNVNLDITQDLIAYLKLRIITAALNEGWEPQFVGGEKRWYARYNFLTEEDCNYMTDEEKCRVPLRSNGNTYTSGGLVCASAYYAASYSNAYHDVRLAFKSKELAEYAAKQFIDIWADFLFK